MQMFSTVVMSTPTRPFPKKPPPGVEFDADLFESNPENWGRVSLIDMSDPVQLRPFVQIRLVPAPKALDGDIAKSQPQSLCCDCVSLVN